MRGRRRAGLLMGLALAAAGPARAWDNQGHMATGAIAYDRLMATDPERVRAIVALMAAHPDRARFERELAGTPAAARDRRLFEYMARWPDDVGGTPADVEDWHYAEQLATPWRAAFPFVFGRAGAALARQAAIAADPRAPAAARAVALCWVFHITGDLQQPLHAGYWVSARFPRSDRGGTRAWVRAWPGAPPMSLHLYWDRAASLPEPEQAGAEHLAAALEQAFPFDARTVRERGDARADFAVWAAESRTLARTVAYRDGAFQPGPRPAAAPAVDTAYRTAARTLAGRRVALGGYRLASLLEATMRRPYLSSQK